MKATRAWRFAALCAAGAFLAACSSNASTTFAPSAGGLAPANALQRDRMATAALTQPVTAGARTGGWLSRHATSPGLIYWGDYNNNVITIYPSKGINPKPVGQITTGVSSPERLYVDRNGYVYTTNIGNGTITAYAPGTTSPSLTISSGIDRPTGLVVGANGTIYCANVGNNTVTVYPKGKTSPSLTIPIAGQPEYLAVDTANDVYVSYLGSSKSGVFEFPPKSTNGKDLGLNIGASGLNAIVLDRSGNIILANDAESYVLIFPAGQTQPSAKIPVSGTPFDLSLNKLETKVFVTVEQGSNFVVQTLAYPKGTALQNKITTVNGDWPIAVSPDAVL